LRNGEWKLQRKDGAWEMHLKNGDGGKEYSTKKCLGWEGMVLTNHPITSDEAYRIVSHHTRYFLGFLNVVDVDADAG
jgi:hypothetical protein